MKDWETLLLGSGWKNWKVQIKLSGKRGTYRGESCKACPLPGWIQWNIGNFRSERFPISLFYPWRPSKRSWRKRLGTSKDAAWLFCPTIWNNDCTTLETGTRRTCENNQSGKKKLDESTTILIQHEDILKRQVISVHDLRSILSKISDKLSRTKHKIEEARAMLGPHMIDNDFFALRHEQKHSVSPWCDKQAQRLRDDAFIAAIKLHKAFIDAAAKPLRHNLGVLMNALSGRPIKVNILPSKVN